jgi:hypothetical protein
MQPLSPLKLAKLSKLVRDGHVAREIERREEERWLAVDDGGMSVLIGLLGRLQHELAETEMAGGSEADSTEEVEAAAQFEAMIAEVTGLIEKLEAMAAREEAEAAGIEQKSVVHSVPPPQLKAERPPPPPK